MTKLIDVPRLRGLRARLWIAITAVMGMSRFVDWQLMTRARDAQDSADRANALN